MVLLIVQPGIPDQEILLKAIKDNVEVVHYNELNKVKDHIKAVRVTRPVISDMRDIHNVIDLYDMQDDIRHTHDMVVVDEIDNSEISLREKISQHTHVGFIWNNSNNTEEIPFEGFSELLHDNLTVDLITCNLNSSDFRKHIQGIENSFTNLNIRYSVNKTGNTQEQLVESDNADWIMESDNVDIKDIYFTDDIAMYHSTLDINRIYDYSKSVRIINKDANGTVTSDVIYSPISHVNYNNTNYETYYINGDNSNTQLSNDILNGATEIHIVLRDIVTIPGYTFWYINNLTSITIPGSVTSIDFAAFYSSGLTNVIFESNSESELIISSWAFGMTPIGSITIPKRITEIGSSAFYKSGLSNVEFEPDSLLQTIGSNAFQRVPINTITIPKSVKSIGSAAFNQYNFNTTLTTVHFERPSQLETIGDNAFGHTGIDEIEIPKSVITLGNDVFWRCENLINVIFQEVSKLQTIGFWAFGRTKLAEIKLPDSLTSLGEGVFYLCTQLTSINGELSNIKEIPKNFARSSSKLEFVECLSKPNNIELVNKYSFFNCNLTMDVIIGNPNNEGSTISYIESNSFPYNSNLKNMTVYNSNGFNINWYYGYSNLSLTIINLSGNLQKDSFDNIKNLYIRSFDSSIKIEDDSLVSHIKKYKEDGVELQTYNPLEVNKKIFNGYGYSSNISEDFNLNDLDFIPTPFTRYFDSSRTNIDISNSNITILYEDTFQELYSLQDISLPGTLERIEYRCFKNCISLQSINFPGTLETIGSEAFSGCSSITSIIIPNTVSRIHGKAFEGVSITEYTRKMDGDTEIFISLDNPDLVNALSGFDYTYSDFDNYETYISEVTNEDGESLGYKFRPPSEWDGLYDVKLRYLFSLYQQHNKTIIEIDIPDNYSFIDDYALQSCNTIKTIHLSDNISYIGRQAFQGCTSLHQTVDNPLKLPLGPTDIDTYCFNDTANICISYHNEGSYFTDYRNGLYWDENSKRFTISVHYGDNKSFNITKKNPDFTKFIDPDSQNEISYTLPSIYNYYDYDNENDALNSKYGTFIEQRNDVSEQSEYKFNVPSHWKYMPNMNLNKFITAFKEIGKNITEIVLPNHLTHFDGHAIDMTLSDVKITKLNLPDSINKLGFVSISRTHVEELVIPESLTEIDSASISSNIGTILNFKNSSNIQNIVPGIPAFLNYKNGRTLFVDNITDERIKEALKDNDIISLEDDIKIELVENSIYQLPQLSSITYKLERMPIKGKYVDGYYKSTIVGSDDFRVGLYFNDERIGSHRYIVNVTAHGDDTIELNDIYDIDFSAGSAIGDPHIQPILGQLYELPNTLSNYRMVEGHNLTINTTTRFFTQQEKDYIRTYYINQTGDSHNIHNLITNGVVQNKTFIQNEYQTILYDFDTQQLKSNTPVKYSLTHKHNRTNITLQLHNKTHGNVTVTLIHYANPQVFSGITVSIQRNIQECVGLLIRNYKPEAFTLPRLTNTESKESIAQENEIYIKPNSIIKKA